MVRAQETGGIVYGQVILLMCSLVRHYTFNSLLLLIIDPLVLSHIGLKIHYNSFLHPGLFGHWLAQKLFLSWSWVVIIFFPMNSEFFGSILLYVNFTPALQCYVHRQHLLTCHLSTCYVTWPTVCQKCKHNWLLNSRTWILVMKGEFIWHQTKVRSIKKSFWEKYIDCFECLHPAKVQSTSSPILPEVTVETRLTTHD